MVKKRSIVYIRQGNISFKKIIIFQDLLKVIQVGKRTLVEYSPLIIALKLVHKIS